MAAVRRSEDYIGLEASNLQRLEIRFDHLEISRQINTYLEDSDNPKVARKLESAISRIWIQPLASMNSGNFHISVLYIGTRR